jgi:8-oxo-dGTP diphosphatase
VADAKNPAGQRIELFDTKLSWCIMTSMRNATPREVKMSEKLVADLIESAGGIVERGTSQEPLVAVVYRERYKGLPKRKRKAGESWQEAALCEVRKETGVTPKIVGIVGADAYVADDVPNLVLYWRMRAEGAVEPSIPNDGVEKLVWLTPAQAIEQLTRPNEAQLVRQAFSQGKEHIEPATTIPPPPWWQRRRWKRLASAIIAYEQELQGRAESFQRRAEGLTAIRGALNEATDALRIRDIDRGWICFHKAHQLELLHLDDAQLDAVAMVMQHEAKKLKDWNWRKKAVLRLLSVDDENQEQKKAEPRRCPKVRRENIFRAAQIRDEHYDNEAYKDSLRRNSMLLFAIMLAVILVAVLGLSYFQYLPFEPTQAAPPQIAILLSVAVFGLLGAIISAIFSSSKAGPLRIPEMVSSFHATSLRLLVGPASAIALYFAARSELSPQVFKSILSSDYGAATLAIAFASGFSEQIVRRVVESFAAET